MAMIDTDEGIERLARYFLEDRDEGLINEALDNFISTSNVDTICRALRSYKRSASERIYVNRPLRFDKIMYFGFDMDYTIACYTKEYEMLCYNHIMSRLVNLMAYPEEILGLPYDSSFVVRGLLIDEELGNFLKVDSFGIINICFHGKCEIPKSEIAKIYASMRIANEEIGNRYYILNTLYNMQEACVFANLVEFFESKKNVSLEGGDELGQKVGEDDSDESVERYGFDIYYKNLWNDVRIATDAMHNDASFRQVVMNDLPRYIEKSDKILELLLKLTKFKKKIFLLTNSPWNYANFVMGYLLDDEKTWYKFFDIVILNACKPSFFTTGSTLRELDPETGKIGISRISGKFLKGKIYSGGNLNIFERMAEIENGDMVLYVGDHIFSDVRVSKKKRGWRTMLIIPELKHELNVCLRNSTKNLLKKLYALYAIKSLIYKNLDSNSNTQPKTLTLRHLINDTVKEKDKLYNRYFGSLFSSGLKSTFFSQQVRRYACLYSSHYSNLLNYPISYSFTVETVFLPHELIQ